MSKFDTYAFRKFEDVRISLIRKKQSRIPKLKVPMNPEEITDLENNCNNEDVLKLKKSIGKTIKIHRNNLNYPAFHCEIDKNHKYYYKKNTI